MLAGGALADSGTTDSGDANTSGVSTALPTNDQTSDAGAVTSTNGTAPDLAPTDQAAPAVAGDGSPVKVIVEDPAGVASAAAAVKAVGGTVTAELGTVGGVAAIVPASQVSALAAKATVQQPPVSAPVAPVVSGSSGDWSVSPTDIRHLIGADGGAAGLDGSGIGVAVLDTGTVPVAGLPASQVIQGPDLSPESQSPATAHLDGYGHGTAMAGIVVGNDGTTNGFRGIAPGAHVVSVKVGSSDGSVDVSQVIAGIDWVVQHKDDPGLNIRVLSLSFGTNSLEPAVRDPLAYAADVAWQHGIVVVAAVGNDGTTAHRVTDPATDPNIIAVGAADTRGSADAADAVPASFSSRGSSARHADLLAPGVRVLTLQDPGSVLDNTFPAARKGNGLFRGSGTSQATAVTSGAAALLLQARPTLTPDQVKALLTGTAVHLKHQPNVWQGAGVINLAGALSAAVPATSPDVVLKGTGRLERTRGDVHLVSNGVMLSGEQDIFGARWSSKAMAAAEATASAWTGGVFNGSTWSGSTWSGSTWSGSTWSGSTWSGSTWSGSTWSGSTWSGSTWSGSTWSGSTWSGSTWSGNTWSGALFSGHVWD